MSLEKAVKAKDEAQKLEALIAAWRKKKHPRIADLIDRVSEPLVKAAGGAVKAKSVPERTKLVVSMLRKPTAIDLGRVLLTEWPGTWDPAMPVIRALVKVPDDPRVAQELARQVDLMQYVSLASIAFYRPLFKRLDELGDVRTKDLLERQLSRSKSEYYARNARKLEERSVAAIKKVKVPALTASEEKWLEQLESSYASVKATQQERGKSGEELLAAVYANPSDLGLRAVYGDWLTQHGDPRGELINLQLAPPTPKSEARIRSLIKQHWRSWVGPLIDWFTRMNTGGYEMPEFKAGFISSCWVFEKYGAERETAKKILDAPEWRTVERLMYWPTNTIPLHEALAHPNFAQVKELRFMLDARELAPLIESGAGARLERISVSLRDEHEPLAWEKLKSVRELTVHASTLNYVRKLLPRLEVLRIDDLPTEDQWRMIESSGVKTVECEGCRLTNGFTTLERMQEGASREEAAVLAAFPKMKVAERQGPPLVSFDLRAPLRSDEQVEKVWQALTTGFGVTFDALDIGGVAHDLTKDPVKRIQVRCRNEKNYYVRLTHRQDSGQKVLLWHRNSEFTVELRDAASFLAALRSVTALVPQDTTIKLGLAGERVEDTAGSLGKIEKFIAAR
jgi:uncharacterized protein (TIGR02996 family)